MPTVFNPRSPYGERHAGNGQRPAAANFNPRSPCGATTPPFSHSSYAVFQSTSPCGERLGRRVRREPRANFNPRPPCGERLLNFHIVLLQNLFQSTLPVWGATAKMHRFFFCIFGKNGIFCDILQIGRHLQGIGRKRRGDFLSRSVRTSRGKYGYLAFAFRESGGLRENRRFYSQSVLFSFRIDCQGSRIEGCPFRGP